MPDLSSLIQKWIDGCSTVNDCLDCQDFQACRLVLLLQNSASFVAYDPESIDLSLN